MIRKKESEIENQASRVERGEHGVAGEQGREPVYLPEESLEREARFHRYAIGSRKLPELRALRAAFAGRAIHSTLEAWTAQVEALLNR